MHCRRNLLRYGLQLTCKRHQRHLSLTTCSARIVKSPLPDVHLPTLSIPDSVWERVGQWPDKVAFECGVTGRRYRYAEARELCKRFAASLRRAGLQPGNTLAIVMPNTAEWPIILLGAMEAGLVITTVNPVYKAEEIARQLRDCEIQALVTLSIILPTIQETFKLVAKQVNPLIVIAPGIEPESHIPVGTVDFWEMIQDGIDTSDVRFAGSIDDTVILPYSSGTTGLPKGVMLSHRNIVSNSAQMNDRSEICLSDPALGSHQDVVPVVLPFFHAYALCIILLAKLIHGVKFVTVPRFEPTSFIKILDEYKATILFVVPPLVHFLATHPGVQKKHLQSLRYLVFGAAPSGSLNVGQFLEKAPSTAAAIHTYGMTELSPTAAQITKDCKNYEPVGIPVPNTEMKIVQPESGRSLGSGEMGEICVRGPQVMKGYLNRPDATAEMIDSDGWLHTGDLGYYDEDSLFYVVDRFKELIKVKGFQVAPAELEEVLRTHPNIEDAAVIGVPNERLGEAPRAYVVTKNSNLSSDDVKNYVAGKVAEYKQLKGGVEFVNSIPKTPSGKILRRQLRKQFG